MILVHSNLFFINLITKYKYMRVNFISQILIKRGFGRLVKKIKELEPMAHEEVVAFLFSKQAALITPWQFREELTLLASEVERLQPKVILEIGTANGGTLFMSSRLADENALIISIDLPGGDFGGGYPDWKVPVYKSFAKKTQQLDLIRADSHSLETFNRIEAILAGRKVDYLFIDGDHTYSGAKQDFEMYKQLVGNKGVVAFHDIVVHKNSRCDVYKLWQEIKEQYRHREFVNDWDQNKFGIGVIYFDSNI